VAAASPLPDARKRASAALCGRRLQHVVGARERRDEWVGGAMKTLPARHRDFAGIEHDDLTSQRQRLLRDRA
jgi:hypothetical protein